MEGPSKAEITCKDNKDGTCTVSYLPTAPGDYSIIVRFDDKHIPGSPFTAKITGGACVRTRVMCHVQGSWGEAPRGGGGGKGKERASLHRRQETYPLLHFKMCHLTSSVKAPLRVRVSRSLWTDEGTCPSGLSGSTGATQRGRGLCGPV